MKNNTIILEATREKNRLKIGIYTPDDAIWHYESETPALDKIEAVTVSVAEALNVAARQGGGGTREFEKLKAVGRMLGDELLTPELKERLGNSDAEYLLLKLDDGLVHIPWELMCVDQDFLCQRFSTGRLVKTRQKIVNSTEREMKNPLLMWILANPGGDLAVAGDEGLKIFQLMAQLNRESDIAEPVLDAQICPDEIKERFKTYDMVHFAGHAEYGSTTNGKDSGWKLSGGNFTVRDIDKMASGAAMPAFVFSNACQSARTEEWERKKESDDGSSFGLANAFLRAGVRHYVGTFWEIPDESGSHFACRFYRLLSSGIPVGKAVRTAREELTKQYGPHICWASYILYGDPRVSYFDSMKAPVQKTAAEPSLIQNTVTRGSLFNYSLNTAKLKEMRNSIAVIAGILLLAAALLSGDYLIDKFNFWQQVRIQEILIAQAEQKQKKTQALFDELTKIIPQRTSSESQPSAHLTMAMVFDSRISFSHQKKENLAAFAIQSELIECSRFRMLERKSFDIILQELIYAKPEKLNLLMPDILLFLEIAEDEDQSQVLMRLVDKNAGVVIDNLFEELEHDKPVFAQKKRLAENLLKKLEKLWPLRGVISEISGEDIRLNIGAGAGVRIGQRFKVIDKEVFLKTVSVETDSCIVRTQKKDFPLQTGWQVESF